MDTRISWVILISSIFLFSEAAGASSYTFNLIANSSGQYSSFASGSINTNGLVTFDAHLDNGSAGVYTTTGDGSYTTVIQSTTSWYSDPSINDSGIVAFIEQAAAGQTIYTSNGGSLTTIYDTSGSPSDLYLSFAEINNAGTVAFNVNFGLTSEAIYTGDGGALTTIANVSGEFNNLGGVAINNNGLVVFTTNLNDGTGGIYTGDGGAPTTIADTSGILSRFDERTSIDDLGNVAFWAELDAGGTGIFTGNGGPLTTIADSSGVYFSVADPLISNNGLVAFEACFDDVTFYCGIFTGPDSLEDVVIMLGDALDGSTAGAFVELLDMNDKGEILFRTTLANNVMGLYVASPIPIPASFWLFGSGLLGLISIARRNKDF